MNAVALVGRLTREPELRVSQDGQTTIVKFNLAVDRRFKKDEADFINIVAFGKTAEFVAKYFSKGQRIGLIGRIQTGSYDHKDGYKVYTTEVIADNVEFVESKANSQQPKEEYPAPPKVEENENDGFMNIPDELEEELPFI